MPDSLITQLHEVLDHERHALLSAEFDALDLLIEQKDRILTQLGQANPKKDQLQPLRAKMDENLTLLAAAIKGVSSARERLEALQSVQKGLSIYDPSGRVELVQNRQYSLEKKA